MNLAICKNKHVSANIVFIAVHNQYLEFGRVKVRVTNGKKQRKGAR